MKKTIYDDSFQDYLVENAKFEGKDEIPCLANLHNVEIPNRLVPFDKAKHDTLKTGYIHFYIHDYKYAEILTNTKKYVSLLSQFDGVITPDPTIVIGKSRCLHTVSTYMNRAVGYYLQKEGIPIIPNIRWGDPSTYEFCFLGIPKKSIVAISTHGAIAKNKLDHNLLRTYFKMGLKEMLKRLEPSDVIVHGYMPKDIFDEFKDMTIFHRYSSEFEQTHKRGD